MEPVGDFLEGEWESLSFSWPIDEANTGGVDESLFYSSDTFSANLLYFSQQSRNSYGSNNNFFPSQENHYFSDSNNHVQEPNSNLESTDFYAMGGENNFEVPFFPDNAMVDIVCLNEEIGSGELGNADGQPANDAGSAEELQLKRKFDIPELIKCDGENNTDPSKTLKKSRVSRDAQKGKKNATCKRSQKLALNGSDNDETNAGTNGQSSSSYSSEADSNTSQELNGGATSESKGPAALNPNGKTRASRGAATDPQSLYARKRRERINERLRILQNLVPNGTKVDISTMLEEAVHYVKFLQLQIKLLSSDELWMFAPIAYNGMDIGRYNKISPTL
ncbi:hypothetical protein U1Q18_005513 [Sarracenia purpurea var. burkii]